MADLRTEKTWVGEFFLPDQHEKRFSGELRYSPSEGVSLTYCIPGREIVAGSGRIFGVLATGEKCSLLGEFSSVYGASNVKNDYITRTGTAYFYCIVVGTWLPQDWKVSKTRFTLTSLQEFFYEGGGIPNVAGNPGDPTYQIPTSYGVIQIFTRLNSKALFERNIHSDDRAVTSEAKNCIADVMSKYPGSVLEVIQDARYEMQLTITNGTEFRTAYGYIEDLANLFALLIHYPVFPDSIWVTNGNHEDPWVEFAVYPSLMCNPWTISLSTRPANAGHMPIIAYGLQLDSIINAWLRISTDHAPIVAAIQHETGLRNLHAALGDVLLFAARMESISYAAQQPSNVKYEYPIQTYASLIIKDGLSKRFHSGSIADAGKAVGELRDDIAHIRRPKVWLSSLTLQDITEISQYLQLIVISHILEAIGIARTDIENYQNWFAPHPR